jgi:hypothetical protein
MAMAQLSNGVKLPEESPGIRQAPVIEPRMVTINSQGFAWKDVQARAPETLVFDDLKLPEIWRRVQAHPEKSLVRLDKVRLIAWDESWLCECVVTAATSAGVTLSKPVKIDLPPRSELLLSDENYAVRWGGSGYYVERKRDGQRVSEIVSTKSEAERALSAQYARPAV